MNVPWFWKLSFRFLEPFAFVTAAFPLMMNGSAWEAWMAVCAVHGTQMVVATEWAWRLMGGAESGGMEWPLWVELVWSCNGDLWRRGEEDREANIEELGRRLCVLVFLWVREGAWLNARVFSLRLATGRAAVEGWETHTHTHTHTKQN